MRTFTGLITLLALFFSLSLFVHTAPAGLEARTRGKKDVKTVLINLKAQVSTHVGLISKCAESGANPSIHVDAIVGLLNGCSDTLSGVSVSLDANAKAEMAQIVDDIFVSVTGACNKVSGKAGLSAYLSLWAKLDGALHLLLVRLNNCVGGILKLAVELLGSFTVGVFGKLKLSLCSNILGLGVGVGAGAGAGLGLAAGARIGLGAGIGY